MNRIRKQKNTTQHSAGFTLVEMIVAVGIFMVVVTVAIGSLLAIADANRKANAIRATMDNLNFSLESMARFIRTGTNYQCETDNGGDCSNGGSTLYFRNQSGDTVAYSFDEANDRIIFQELGGPQFAVTAPEVIIDDLTFYVIGTDAGDDVQPRVVITIQGTAGLQEDTQSTFNIQTTASQRSPDS